MPIKLSARTRIWLRRLAGLILMTGLVVAIPSTISSFDFTIRKRSPGSPSWRKVGTSVTPPAPSSVILEQQMVRDKALFIAFFGYGGILLGVIILLAVKKPPPWAGRPSRHSG